jgi:serine/threonine protein kinase
VRTFRPALGGPLLATPFGDARYELLERIGQGGAATVHRAREHAGAFTREVCIKRLAAGPVDELAAALREEARLLAAVRHANVVSLVAAGEEGDGCPFLVLELVDGWNLRRFCRALQRHDAVDGGFLPDPLAVHVACAVLRALAAIGRALPGIVHRDVTPHNVLVSREGEVKLADFGIARALDRARWTRPALVKGKLGYIAPEQLRDEPLDPRADIFAVGVLLYELLTRVRPWGAARGMPELRAIELGAHIPLAAHSRRRNPALVAVVEKLFRPRRADRFATPDDAVRALAPFSAGDFGSLRLASLGCTLIDDE